jgi:hypothetical protein
VLMRTAANASFFVTHASASSRQHNEEYRTATRFQRRWRRIAICLSFARPAAIFIIELGQSTVMGTRKGGRQMTFPPSVL